MSENPDLASSPSTNESQSSPAAGNSEEGTIKNTEVDNVSVENPSCQPISETSEKSTNDNANGESSDIIEETQPKPNEKAVLESSQNSEESKSTSVTKESESETESTSPTCPSAKIDLPEDLVDRIKGVIYGNCIGDAIGLLTEFMSKEQARMVYRPKGILNSLKAFYLEYHQKSNDSHRIRWKQGDWTDDSDQMILILLTLVENDGQFVETVFGSKLWYWVKHGYPELGDSGGMGLGMTTGRVLRHPCFMENPCEAAHDVWVKSNRKFAPNGGVMRTSILGTMEFHDLEKVIANTKSACQVTHADPRCVASCIAVTVAIALMLQGKHMNKGEYKADEITRVAHKYAEEVVEDEDQKQELKQYMFEQKLEKLKLDESSSIGYTLKCLGAGFWAFKQKDFRDAIQKITMEAGDADTNCAVAGALLGCKVGFNKLPESWVTGLCHRKWLDGHITRFVDNLEQEVQTYPNIDLCNNSGQKPF